MSEPQRKCQLFEDVRTAVYEDGFMWVCIWGPPRASKSTIAGWIAHSLYKDWPKTLACFGYNISQIMRLITHGEPEKWPTRNGLHMRVPIVVYDDFGSSTNKAATQHDVSFDMVKGLWDVLATKVAVIVATMCDPTEATLQLQRYTHEVQVLRKGSYKYDSCVWQQNFRGWQTRPKKIFIEENTFDMWPDQVYREYDEQRQELCDEAFVRVEDATVASQLDFIMKLSKPKDFEILKLIDTRGPIEPHEMIRPYGSEEKLAITRLKARQLIVPIHDGKPHLRYDLSPLGQAALSKLLAGDQPKQNNQSDTPPSFHNSV